MTVLWATCTIVGLLLAVWAAKALPAGTLDFPVPPIVRTARGPYRWLTHPMYVGTVLLVVGLAGLAAGVWNALALGTLAELVMREWAWRERETR